MITNRDQQLGQIRQQESDMHRLELNLSEVNGKLRDKAALEKRIAEMRQEIVDVNAQLKVRSPAIVAAP